MKINRRIKIFLALLVAIFSLIFIYSFFLSFSKKSKANIDKVLITFSQPQISVKQDEELMIGVSLKAENQKKISAVDLSFKFDSDDKDLLDYVSFIQSPDNYFDKQLIEKEIRRDGSKILRIVLLTQKPDSQLRDSFLLNLKFKAKKTGKTVISLLKSSSQVVGTASTENFQFGDQDIQSDITVLKTSGVQPLSAKIILNMVLKFQGIERQPVDPENRKMAVKVILAGISLSQPIEKEVLFNADRSGFWSGSADFSQVFPGPGYRVYIKGPKHLQKKVCILTPDEKTKGGYHCSLGENFSLQEGKNKLNFSKIYMLVGDLPVQDGIVNSYDLSYVRNNLGKSGEKTLLVGDVNLDGIIDTQDYSLVIKSLSIRTDEE